jgi:hypothetical protein
MKEISRRDFLKISAISMVALFLSTKIENAGDAPADTTTKEDNSSFPKSDNSTQAEIKEITEAKKTQPVSKTATPPLNKEAVGDPSEWKNWPIVPEFVNPEIVDIYNSGISKRLTNSHVFSKAGDCESVPTSGYLFGQFDFPNSYKLGKHQDLEATIKWFEGSWSWFPPTVHGGQNAAGILSVNPILKYDNNHQKECLSHQSYLECEVALRQPSLLLISYEQESQSPENYKKYLSTVVKYAIDHYIIPIVTTCANSEAINKKVAEVAVENRIPTWNFWKAVQPLKYIFDPNLNDGFHLSYAGETGNFDFTLENPCAWNIRNLTGLQTMNAVLSILNPDYRKFKEAL